jgi:hypothetical protein
VLAAQKPGWPVQLHYPGTLAEAVEYNRILSTPAITDLNDDGVPDLVVGSNERLGAGQNAGAFYVLDGRGNDAPGGPVLPGWPVSMTSLQLFPLVAEGVPNSPVAGTFDGVKAAVMHGNASLPLIVPVDPGGQSQLTATPENAIPQRPDAYDPTVTQKGVDPSSKFGPLSDAPQPNTMLPLFAQPSLGDLDQDGTPDVIATGGSLNLAINLQSQSGTGLQGDHLLARSGAARRARCCRARPSCSRTTPSSTARPIADVDGRSTTPRSWHGLRRLLPARLRRAAGAQPAGWPKFTGQWIISTPALGDLDGDGQLEVARRAPARAGSTPGTPAAPRTAIIGLGRATTTTTSNTGNYDAPADFGVKNGTATPLTVEVCEALIGAGGGGAGGGGGDALTPGGGCSCRLDAGPTEGSSPGDTRGGLAALAAMGLALARRRRARA